MNMQFLALCAVLCSIGSVPAFAECLFQPISFAVAGPHGTKLYERPVFQLLQTPEESLDRMNMRVDGNRLVAFFGDHVSLIELSTGETIDRGEVICGPFGGYVLWRAPSPKEPVEDFLGAGAVLDDFPG